MNSNILKILIFFFLFVTSAFGQERHSIDSLQQVIKNLKYNYSEPSPKDTSLFNTYLLLENELSLQYPDSALAIDYKILRMVKRQLLAYPNTELTLKSKEYLADIYNNIGYIYAQIKSDSEKGLEYFTKALKLYEELENTVGISSSYNNIGYIYDTNGDIKKALDFYHKSLKINEKNNDKEGIAISYNNIGNIYDYQGDTASAFMHYYKGLEIWEELNDKAGLALSYNNIGSIYEINGEIEKAIEFHEKSLQISIESGDKEGIAMSYNNIGYVYNLQGNIEKATDYFTKSITISKEIGQQQLLISSYQNLGGIYLESNQISEATKYITKAYGISKELSIPIEIEATAAMMKELSLMRGDYRKAFEYHQEEITMRDSVQNEENFKLIQKQQAFYEYQKKSAIDSIAHSRAIQIKDLFISQQKAESDKQKMISLFTFFGLFVVIVFLGFLFRLFLQKKKANQLLAKQKTQIIEKNEELNQLVEEVTAQRDEIETKKVQIESIHSDVSRSIDYATRLQESIMPDTKILKRYLSDYFVLLKPKDNVSGDFYWWAHVENQTIITAVDCTGHGVPGAFMSMLGISFLREIVMKEYITHPGVILRKLRKEIVRTLKQKGEAGTHKDGMDMAIISLNHETNILEYSGANNSLYIITSSELQILSKENRTAIKLCDNSKLGIKTSKLLYEIKPDKMPIAIYEKMDKFTTHEIQLEKGDQVYLFSDGFADQFGGAKGKKFKYKSFKQLIIENADKPMEQQNEVLNTAFNKWKGTLEQVDDVVIVGVKV